MSDSRRVRLVKRMKSPKQGKPIRLKAFDMFAWLDEMNQLPQYANDGKHFTIYNPVE